MWLEEFNLELQQVYYFNTQNMKNNWAIESIQIFQSEKNSFVMIIRLNWNEINLYFNNIKWNFLSQIFENIQKWEFEWSDNFEYKPAEDFRKIWLVQHLGQLYKQLF